MSTYCCLLAHQYTLAEDVISENATLYHHNLAHCVGQPSINFLSLQEPHVALVCAQGGNNNTYCHDSELNWFNWEQAAQDESGYARFFRHLINFRYATCHFLKNADQAQACTIYTLHDTSFSRSCSLQD